MFLQIRNELEQHMSCNLKEYKEFIDNEMLLILGQMDKATHIFDHVYLVRMAAFLPFRLLCLCSFYIAWAGFFLLKSSHTVFDSRKTSPDPACFFPLQGSEWNASNLEELHECG